MPDSHEATTERRVFFKRYTPKIWRDGKLVETDIVVDRIKHPKIVEMVEYAKVGINHFSLFDFETGEQVFTTFAGICPVCGKPVGYAGEPSIISREEAIHGRCYRKRLEEKAE